jgi:hypothetical protein
MSTLLWTSWIRWYSSWEPWAHRAGYRPYWVYFVLSLSSTKCTIIILLAEKPPRRHILCSRDNNAIECAMLLCVCSNTLRIWSQQWLERKFSNILCNVKSGSSENDSYVCITFYLIVQWACLSVNTTVRRITEQYTFIVYIGCMFQYYGSVVRPWLSNMSSNLQLHNIVVFLVLIHFLAILFDNIFIMVRVL